MPPPSTWRTERLLFRAVETEDEPFLSSLSNDDESFMNAAPFIPIPQGKISAKGFREYLESTPLAAIVCLPPAVTDPVLAAAGGEGTKPTPIGIVNFSKDDARMFHHRRTEIGITLARPYHGQGYGSEAIKWILNFGFRHSNLHRIGIACFGYNTGALRLYERLGFKVESRKRDWMWHDGQYHDLVELAMLEDEWRELYEKK